MLNYIESVLDKGFPFYFISLIRVNLRNLACIISGSVIFQAQTYNF